jgi:hypothetical protein
MSLLQFASQSDSFENRDDPRWQLALRIAGSGILGRSSLLSDFLLYICDRHIRGRSAEITEQQIGVQVFGRREGYNSNDDNIVRNYARTLRKRIDEYFATQGGHEELILEIPRGGYVPVFRPSRPAVSGDREPLELRAFDELLTPEAVATRVASPTQDRLEQDISCMPGYRVEATDTSPSTAVLARIAHLRRIDFNSVPLLAIVFLLATGFVCVYLFVHRVSPTWGEASRSPSPVAQRNHAFWARIFQDNRDTFIVPADSGLSIMENLTRRPVSLADYTSGNYHTESPAPGRFDPRTIRELGTRGYTSIVVLEFVAHLAQLGEVVPERMLIRHPHDLRMQDLRSGNAILIGSVDANPWDELFEQQLNFRFAYNPKDINTSPVIVSEHPLAGEKTVYSENDLSEPIHNTYGVIDFLPNLDGTGHVVLVAGINMAGTEAAGRFLLDPVLMANAIEHATRPDGDIHPFEILIEASNLAANTSRLRLISERVY